jgi:hypothetical protein
MFDARAARNDRAHNRATRAARGRGMSIDRNGVGPAGARG